NRVGGGGVFHAQRAVDPELDADDADVVGGVGGDRNRAGHGGAGGRRGDGDRRGRGIVRVGDGDGDRAGGGAVAGGVARPRGQGVGAVAGGGGIPGDRVGGAGVLCAEVGAVEQELDAGHADVVGGAGGHGDGAGDCRAGRRGR